MERRKWVVINQNKYMLLLHNVKDLPQYDIFKKVPKKLVNAIKKATKKKRLKTRQKMRRNGRNNTKE